MKRQIRLLVENLFDELYDIDQESNLTIDIADKIYKNTKENLRKEIEEELKIQGPDADLNDLNTYGVTDMSRLFVFYNGLKIKNIKIDKWDVSNVTDMSYMFYYCENFNGNLSDWDVSNVTNMAWMFYNCRKFNGKGLENWNVSNVTDMDYMFDSCWSLKIPSWYNG